MAQRELNAKNWEHMHTRGMRRGNTDDVVSPQQQHLYSSKEIKVHRGPLSDGAS
jgi:hypothetical protein